MSAAALFLLSIHAPLIADDRRVNVLFLAADDLRPQFHCYGVDWMHTPNIDALAALELYDHQKDPQENHNLANHPENAALIKRLTTQLQNGWQQAKP